MKKRKIRQGLFFPILLACVAGTVLLLSSCNSQAEACQRSASSVSSDSLVPSAQAEAEVPATPSPVPESWQIDDFPLIFQLPELPTGCEVTALAMMLNYYGLETDKTQLAGEYLPTVPAQFYYGEDGLLYGPDMNRFFVGDPFTEGGYICGTEAILTAANSYLADRDSSLLALDASSSSPEDLFRLVSQDTPVLVWVTIVLEDRQPTEGWYSPEGVYQEWSTNDHGAVLIGYSEDTVTLADPLAGIAE